MAKLINLNMKSGRGKNERVYFNERVSIKKRLQRVALPRLVFLSVTRVIYFVVSKQTMYLFALLEMFYSDIINEYGKKKSVLSCLIIFIRGLK